MLHYRSTLRALTVATAFAQSVLAITFPLPYKALDCTKYPTLDTPVAANADFTAAVDLTGVPDLKLNTYNLNLDICPQHAAQQLPGYCNAECGCRTTETTKCVTAGQWAPSYDDGPSPFTATVLSTLKSHNDTKAIFFVVGSRLCQNANAMIDAINAGHEIGVHTWSHPRLTTLSNERVIAEIKWTEKAIMELTGIQPKFMRPPNGNLDNRIRFIMDKLGYTPVVWIPDTNDWQYNYITNPTDKQITAGTNAILGNISSYIISNEAALTGTISLEHDIAKIPTSAASTVLDTILQAGWKLVTMTTCTGASSWAQNVQLVGGNNLTDAPLLTPTTTAKPAAATSATSAKAATTTAVPAVKMSGAGSVRSFEIVGMIVAAAVGVSMIV